MTDDEYPCLICDKPVKGYVPEMCCDGMMCNCRAQPVNPCTCSDACDKALFDIDGSFEDRRIRHNITKWTTEPQHGK